MAMSLFQLDPVSIAQRWRAVANLPSLPTLSQSIRRGAIGFTVMSLAGFAPWALFGRWFHRNGGELAMYLACAVVFVGLSGICLQGLILGPGSRSRFYRLFSLAFSLYSVGWIVGWMALRGHTGSVVGLLAGTAVMGAILTTAFGARDQLMAVAGILFLSNSLGYFLGGVCEGTFMAPGGLAWLGDSLTRSTQMRIAMFSWGLCYGLGFGAGLGWAFHRCQARARELIASPAPPP